MSEEYQSRASASTYKAFMSYSHAADGHLAPALQRGIQRLGKPWYRRPVIRVFRDETSLSANPGLWSAIESALGQCEYFLLMCSTKAAASPWVQKEVQWWLGNRPIAKLLLVVTDGEIAWNGAAGDFNWKATNCLPEVLRGRFREVPYYIDVRWARDRKDLSLRNTRFRAAVLTLAAPLHGRMMEELDSEDIRRQKWLRKAVVATGAVVGGLAITAAVELHSARDEGAKAESRRVAAQAMALMDDKQSIEHSILLGVLAWRLSHTDEARSALVRLSTASADVAGILHQHTGSVEKVAFGTEKDGHTLLATGGRDGSIMLWHLPEMSAAGPPLMSDQDRIFALQISDGGAYVLSSGASGKSEETDDHFTLILHNVAARTWKRVPTEAFSRKNEQVYDTELSPDGRRVAGLLSNSVALWDSATGVVMHKEIVEPARSWATKCIRFQTNTRLVWASSFDDEWPTRVKRARVMLSAWDLASDRLEGGVPAAMGGPNGDQTDVQFRCSRDGSKVAVWSTMKNFPPWMLDTSGTNLALRSMPGLSPIEYPLSANEVDWDAHGKRVAITNAHGKTVVQETASQKIVKDTQLPVRRLSLDGRWLASDSGDVMILDLDASDPKAPGNLLKASCSLAAEEECVRRLCEKVSPMITDRALQEALPIADYNRLKALHLTGSCAAL